MNLEEKKKNRFNFLKYLYDKTDGSTSSYVNMFDIGKQLNFSRNDTSKIVEYLIGEFLVESKYKGGGIGITHDGVLEIEDSISNPNEPTEHFMAYNNIHIENMNNSAIQQGSVHSIQEVQFNIDKNSLVELIDIIESCKDSLNLEEEAKQELIAETNTLKSQNQSPKPKSLIITESLKTIRNLIEGGAAGVMAPKIIEMVNGMLS